MENASATLSARKRSVGVIFTTVTIVIIAALILSARGIFNLTYALPKKFVDYFTLQLLIFGFLYTLILPLCLTIGGIGLLFLKSWSRKIIITCLWIDVLIELAVIAISCFTKKITNPAPLIMRSYIIALVETSIIYFLTRPKVKRQFVNEEGTESRTK